MQRHSVRVRQVYRGAMPDAIDELGVQKFECGLGVCRLREDVERPLGLRQFDLHLHSGEQQLRHVAEIAVQATEQFYLLALLGSASAIEKTRVGVVCRGDGWIGGQHVAGDQMKHGVCEMRHRRILSVRQ